KDWRFALGGVVCSLSPSLFQRPSLDAWRRTIGGRLIRQIGNIRQPAMFAELLAALTLLKPRKRSKYRYTPWRRIPRSALKRKRRKQLQQGCGDRIIILALAFFRLTNCYLGKRTR